MKKIILAFILLTFSFPAWAGDLTSNGYFYLPAKGSYGTAERNYWLNVLNQTDSILKGMADAIAVLQESGGGGEGGSSIEWENDGSRIYNSDTFSNVGIGTHDPQYTLDVSGNINSSGAITINNVDVCLLDGSNCPGVINGWTDVGPNVYLIDTTDNVGIGTVSPAGKLHVAGGGVVIEGDFSGMLLGNGMKVDGDTTRKMTFSQTGGTYDSGLRVDLDTTSGVASFDSVSTVPITEVEFVDIAVEADGVRSISSLTVGETYSANQTAPTNGALIQGNVGIGTFAPSTNFQVTGNARITGLAANECVQTTTGGLLTTSGSACGAGGGGGVGVGTVNPGTIGALPFYTASTTVDDSPVIFTDGTNIGIGSTGPTVKLQVVGGITSSGTITANAFSGDGSALTGLPANSGWTDGGTNVYTSTTTDRVGIGTTTPNATTSLEIVKQSSNQPFKISSAATTNGDYLTVTSAGNVGVGTINPVAKLVASASDTTTYTATATTGATLGIANTNTTVNNMSKLDFNTANSANAITPVASITAVATDHTNASEDGNLVITTKLNGTFGERMRIMNDGNVGFGTTTPVGGLVVMNGHVGIGTWSPTAKLQVVGAVTATSFAGDGSGLTNLASTSGGWSDGGTNVHTSTTTDTVGIGTTGASGSLEIVKQGSAIPFMVSATATGDGDYLVINSAGNIGIGTTTSLNSKLTVNGGITSLGTSAGSLVLNESTANGSNTITVSAPASLSDNRSCTLQDDSTPFDDCISAPTAGGGWVDGGTNMYQSTTTDNVGIGSTTPSNRLSIVGSSSGNVSMNVQNTNSSGVGSVIVNNSAGLGFSMVATGSGYAVPSTYGVLATAGESLSFGESDGTINMTISGTGNIGIGSTAPNGSLNIRNTTDSIGWTVAVAGNQACNTTCTSGCVFGIDNDSTTNSLLNCSDASSDRCLCAGSN